MRVDALNRGHICELSLSGLTSNIYKQHGTEIGGEGVNLGGGLSGDCTASLELLLGSVGVASSRFFFHMFNLFYGAS